MKISKNRRGAWVRAILLSVLAASLLSVPGGGQVARAASDKIVLKVALIVPRSPSLAVEEKKYNKRLKELSDGKVQVRVYWGGAAGGEKDVLRKMRTGQIDGSPFSLEVMSQFVRECLVLTTPGLFTNYKQVDAVREALIPEFDAEAYRNGYKVMGWGDIGRLRLFSKQKITRIGDFKRVRPWLYPESEMLKGFYKQIGATGVPLGIEEVYAGMQTGMIDTFWGTAVLAAALQWHRTAKYISKEGLGFISGAFVFRRESWDKLPEPAQQAMLDIVKERARKAQLDIRKADEKAFKRLLKRGYTALDAQDPAEWWNAGHELRRRMVGRIYTQSLVDRAERIAMKYASKEQLAYWKKK